MKHTFLIFILIFIVSCGGSDKETLLNKISNITKCKQKKFYVIIISDSDCSSCIENVIKKASKLNASEVYGIYFTDSKINHEFSGHIEHIINQKKLLLNGLKIMIYH